MSVHDLFDDVAQAAPTADPLQSADDAWGSAVRRRRRARITAGAAVLGLVVVAVLVGASVARPAPKPLPGNGELAPGQGLPARIYTVKPWLDTIGSTPIPPIAYVYSGDVRSQVAVSVDGSYRYLPNEHPKDVDTLSSYAVSPDGRLLAVAWSPSSLYVPSPLAVVVAYDVVAGAEVGRWTTAEGGSSEIVDLVWSADGSALGWEETVATSFVDGGIVGGPKLALLDLGTGQVARRADLRGPLAWSPDGATVAARDQDGVSVITPVFGGPGTPIERADDSLPTLTELSFAPNGWSPDGQTLAGLSCGGGLGVAAPTCQKGYSRPMALALAATGEATYSDPFGSASYGQVLGWRDGEVMLGLLRSTQLSATGGPYLVGPVDAGSGASTGPTLIRSEDFETVNSLVVARDLLADAPIVDLPPPAQPRLSWSYARWALSEHALAIGLLVLAFAVGAAIIRPTRRRRGLGR